MSENTKTNDINLNIDDALQGIAPALPVIVVRDVPYSYHVATPPDWKVTYIDEEALLPAPRRIKAELNFNRAESLVGYLEIHATAHSKTYLDIDEALSKLKFVAIIDDNGNDEPHWRGHRAVYEPVQSVEWLRWTARTGYSYSQIDFAVWIEDNIADISGGEVDGVKYPTGAEMLALATNFEACSDKHFKSKTNLQSGGIRLELVDDDDDQTRSNLDYFAKFRIGLRVFRGAAEPGYPLEVRLRHAVNGGKLYFTYHLIRPDLVFETAAKELAERIEKESAVAILYGKP